MEGYMQNGQGHLVPVDQVKEVDKTRHSLVMEVVERFEEARGTLTTLKTAIMEDIDAFVELSAEQYNVKLGGNKGNVTLTSYDGKYKVQRAVQELFIFDERLKAAKQLVDECLKDWTKDSGSELKAIVNNAFNVDRDGRFNVKSIMGLRRLEISDERWKKAMDIIGDSLAVVSSKEYIRVYRRDEKGGFEQLPLDISAL